MKKGCELCFILVFSLMLIMPLASAECGFFCRLGNVFTGKATVVQAMPDLIVEDISILTGTAANIYYPNQVRIEGYVKNIGNANASRSYVEVDLTPPQLHLINQGTSNECYSALSNRLTNSPIPANDLISGETLGPGQRERFTGYFNPSESGTINLNIIADYENKIAESNENNNILSKSFYVEKTIEKSKYRDCNAAQYTPCTDSDGGKDYYVKGKAVNNANPSGFEDKCTTLFGKSAVEEYYCDQNGSIYFNVQECLYGCSNGACMKEPIKSPCTDSDRGTIPDIYGYTTIDNGLNIYPDKCYYSNGVYTITEQFCKSDTTDEFLSSLKISNGYNCESNDLCYTKYKCNYCENGVCTGASNYFTPQSKNICQDVYAFACRQSCFSNEEQATYSCPTGICCKPKSSATCLAWGDCSKKECNNMWVELNTATAGLGRCEYGKETSCSDNFDNDADGLVDTEDYDCSAKPEISTKYVLQRDIAYTDEEGVYKYIAGSAGPGADWIGGIVRENEGYSAEYKCKDGCDIKAFVFEFNPESNSQQNLERSIKDEFCQYFDACYKTQFEDVLVYSFSNPKSSEETRIEYGAAWVSYNKIILIAAYSCNLPQKACLTSIGMVSGYLGIFPTSLEEEEEVCPLIVGWRIEKDKCVSDAGCDYSPEKYKYYNSFEECNSQLEKCIPEWSCVIEPKECPSTGIQTKTCTDTRCLLGRSEEKIICKTGECSGCMYDSTCVPFGYKMKIGDVSSYCSINKAFEKQKELGEECQNDHECLSDDCSDGKCISTYTLMQAILNFLKKIFGG